MRGAAVLAFVLWVSAAPVSAQSLSIGAGAPPLSPETETAIREAHRGRPEALRKLVEAGRPDAQLYAGIYQTFGAWGFAKDGAKGCALVKTAATARPDALHILGECLQYGYGGEKDLEKAVILFREAGDKGMAKSRCAEGNLLIELGRDQTRAVDLCRQGAEAGDADAQTDLGNFYLTGRFVTRDIVEARRWYEKAAAQGQANAAFVLGQIYWNGDGVAKDNAAAARNLRIAYDRGRRDAALLLGDEAYVRAGRGKGRWDIEGLKEAEGWYARAVEAVDMLSDASRKVAAERLILVRDLQGVMRRQSGDARSNMTARRDDIQRRAEAGQANPAELRWLGEAHMASRGGRQKALGYWKQAADAGDPHTPILIADHYFERIWGSGARPTSSAMHTIQGSIPRKSVDEALKWYRLALERDDRPDARQRAEMGVSSMLALQVISGAKR